jgi:SAM-dependent methyltransferase
MRIPILGSRRRRKRLKPTIFIGSSGEVRKRGIVSKLVLSLSDLFDVRPWYDVFDNGQFTLEALLETAREADGAILLFAHDDERQRRGETTGVARDNVVLEYGIFISELGRERVWVLKEEGTDGPTDMDGLTVSPFATDSEPIIEASLDLCIKEIRRKWKHLQPRERLGEHMTTDGGLGLIETLHGAKTELDEILADLRSYVVTGRPHRDGSIQFDSTNRPIAAYAEALENVRSRFWTTTFLSSGFWTQENKEVIGANRRMLERVLPRGGSVRRLFLLNHPPAQEARSRKQRLIHLRAEGATQEEALLRKELRVLKKNISELMELGCEVRVAYHGGAEIVDFPRPVRFDPTDSEIAIYDDFRVDFFGGGRKGNVTDVQIFSRATSDFEDIHTLAEDYLDTLWKGAASAEGFILRLEECYEAANKRIDYASNWLVKFEFNLEPHDEELKNVEIEWVEDLLQRNGRWGAVERYLDIGTCTARYPIALRDAIVEKGYILGVDEDADCIKFSSQRVREKTGSDPRIHLRLLDFTRDELPGGGGFDLITCMLGTVSHFGWNRSDRFDDVLQHSLCRMSRLLTPNGFLVVSCWSEHACSHQRMLSIYRPQDTHRLTAWTPGREELQRRIATAGLEVVEDSQLELRLNLYVCRRRP